MTEPRLIVFTTLFPHPGQPNAGVFIRERMFRVGQHLPLVVVAPVPWFPFQGLIRKFKPHFRPEAPREEEQQGFKVYHPRFFSIPGLLKFMDGLFMALGSYTLMVRLKREFHFNVIDAHFAYPDGYAAAVLKRWLGVKATITLRGTEVPHSKTKLRRLLLIKALKEADQIFSVSNSLKQHAIRLGIPGNKIQVVGNGVDTKKFFPLDKEKVRDELGIPQDAKVLITVGGLCERKGFHRVLKVIPELLTRHDNLHYFIVGGPSAEGDWTEKLKQMVTDLKLEMRVQFLGTLPSDQIKKPLSAADVFVLSTRNEGWANVILEAMACGLPVVATDVGGNAEVVSKETLGSIVSFDDDDALQQAISKWLESPVNREVVSLYVSENSWDTRVASLLASFHSLADAQAFKS